MDERDKSELGHNFRKGYTKATKSTELKDPCQRVSDNFE